MIDFTKPVTTRHGKSVRILCTDAPGIQPIVGIILGTENEIERWNLDGTYFENSSDISNLDLINPPQKEVRYMNVYPDHIDFSLYPNLLYKNRKDADLCALIDRIACIRIEFTPGQFDE